MKSLSSLATGREESLFWPDLKERASEIARVINGQRILVVGGAGSIGSSTIKALSEFEPAAIHVIDQNENQLTELVRDLRSSFQGLRVKDFLTMPLDFGSPITQRWIDESEPYDHVFNFAAIKHVRSEKNVHSLLQMFDTNIVKPLRFMSWLRKKGATKRYFCVSTDKAANPVNLMGATKRLMEHVIFDQQLTSGITVTSARFANVAFSEGSLLQSFLRRLEKRQPIAAPRDTRRYFVSLQESGQICLLASTLANHGTILVPKFQPEGDLNLFEDVAKAFLQRHGFQARIYQDEALARTSVESDILAGGYPLLLTPLDTEGEKGYEEFVGQNERDFEMGLKTLKAVDYVPMAPGDLQKLVARVQEFIENPDQPVSKADLLRLVQDSLPEFHHNHQTNTLDERM